MQEPKDNRWNFENLADELKSFLFLNRKKGDHRRGNVPKDFNAQEKIHFDEIHVPESESHNISLSHVLKIEEVVKLYKKLGKLQLANTVREFTDYLVNDPHLVCKEKNEIVEKFADLIKEISTPEIYQKTRLLNTLYPEVKNLVSKNEELETRWTELEAAIANAKMR